MINFLCITFFLINVIAFFATLVNVSDESPSDANLIGILMFVFGFLGTIWGIITYTVYSFFKFLFSLATG